MNIEYEYLKHLTDDSPIPFDRISRDARCAFFHVLYTNRRTALEENWKFNIELSNGMKGEIFWIEDNVRYIGYAVLRVHLNDNPEDDYVKAFISNSGSTIDAMSDFIWNFIYEQVIYIEKYWEDNTCKFFVGRYISEGSYKNGEYLLFPSEYDRLPTSIADDLKKHLLSNIKELKVEE